MSDFLNVLVVGVLLGGIYSLVSIGLNLIFGVIDVTYTERDVEYELTL